MSNADSQFEQCSPERPPEHRSLRFPSKATLLSITLIAVVGASIAYWYERQQPWLEIIGKDVLRTNATSRTIALARDAVIQKHQNWVVDEDGRRRDPSYQGGARTWSTGPSPDEIRVKVIRGKTQITDKNAATLSIESISVTDTPTLVFINYDDPGEKLGLVNELVSEFVNHGVKLR